ncbi:MAG: hypothetical protein JSS54_16735 [Proteobacteria bacterium]|nr:hypothetical protein [Pseudomonadota bacterium]MBS0270604.1 hypothetical protein [Pseudomonadota bacterium]
MPETVRRREIANAVIVASLWAAISIAISAAVRFDLLLPMLSSLVIYAAVESFRFSRGTPLGGSTVWRMAALTFWTMIGYGTFVLGHWYMLPISLTFLGIVLFENAGILRPSAAAPESTLLSTQSVANNCAKTDAPRSAERSEMAV